MHRLAAAERDGLIERDHLHVRISFETRVPETLNTILRNPLLRAKMGARWLVDRW